MTRKEEDQMFLEFMDYLAYEEYEKEQEEKKRQEEQMYKRITSGDSDYTYSSYDDYRSDSENETDNDFPSRQPTFEPLLGQNARIKLKLVLLTIVVGIPLIVVITKNTILTGLIV